MFGGVSAEPARQRLLLAGLHLFAEHGYAKASIRKIAIEAGANVAAISYYFGGKAGLYQAVFWGGHVPPGAAATVKPFKLESLDQLFQRILEPLRSGKAARSWMKLQRREMLEPSGLWQEKMEHGMAPMHAALVAHLCRRLGMSRPDDEVHALALQVIGPAVHLLVNCEVVDMLVPQLLDGPDAVDAWRERLARSAEAVIEAERRRRLVVVAPLSTAKSVAAHRPASLSHRSARSKA
jgi:hypothetical protein